MFNESDSEYSQSHWQELIDTMEKLREPYNMKRGWSPVDIAEVEEIDEQIYFYECMLDWCWARDENGYDWSSWIASIEEGEQKVFEVNPILGELPAIPKDTDI
jgi:hypothetical protein